MISKVLIFNNDPLFCTLALANKQFCINMNSKMRSDLYKECYEQETFYWWHRAKQNIVLKEFKKYRPYGKLKILDIGCGTGGMLKKLEALGSVFGIDNSKKAVSFCKKQGLNNVTVADITKPLPFKNNQFDLVLALDVVEHIKYPKLMIGEVRRVLKPGGIFIVTVPAYQFLFSYWDEILGHYRRYEKNNLKRFLLSAHFKVKDIFYFHSSVLLPAIIFRTLKNKNYQNSKMKTEQVASDFIPLPSWLNLVLLGISNLEQQLSNFIKPPFGLSIIAVAKKPLK